MECDGSMWLNNYASSTEWVGGYIRKFVVVHFFVGPWCGCNKCIFLLLKTWDSASPNKQRVAYEKNLTHQYFLEYPSIGIIWTEDSYYKYSSHISLSLYFNPVGASISSSNLIPYKIKFLNNKGHPNKRFQSYEAFENFSRRITQISDSYMKKGFPHSIGGIFQPYIDSNNWITFQYW